MRKGLAECCVLCRIVFCFDSLRFFRFVFVFVLLLLIDCLSDLNFGCYFNSRKSSSMVFSPM